MSEELYEGSNAVEAKLAEAGADEIRRHSFSEAPEAAPDDGTPAETVDEGQPRNELGQFASQEATTEDQEAPVEEVQSGRDPAAAAFLAKYGGDVDKALAGAVHLQRKSGEQSNELGDLRKLVEDLAQLQQADYQSRQQNQPIDQGTVDWFDEQVLQNPQGAVEYARQQGNNILFQRGLATWKEIQPYEAAVYTNNLNNQQLQQYVDQRMNAASQLPADANMHMALANVRAQHPEYSNYDDSLEATLQKHPFAAKALEQAAASGDRQQLEGAIGTLYSLAIGDTLAQLALTGDAPENVTSSTGVVTPTTSETREEPEPPSPTDAFRAAFREEADRARKGVWVAD